MTPSDAQAASRASRGDAALELVGVLCCVAIVCLGLLVAAPGWAQDLTGGVQRVVCTVTVASDCGAPGERAGSTDAAERPGRPGLTTLERPGGKGGGTPRVRTFAAGSGDAPARHDFCTAEVAGGKTCDPAAWVECQTLADGQELCVDDRDRLGVCQRDPTSRNPADRECGLADVPINALDCSASPLALRRDPATGGQSCILITGDGEAWSFECVDGGNRDGGLPRFDSCTRAPPAQAPLDPDGCQGDAATGAPVLVTVESGLRITTSILNYVCVLASGAVRQCSLVRASTSGPTTAAPRTGTPLNCVRPTVDADFLGGCRRAAAADFPRQAPGAVERLWLCVLHDGTRVACSTTRPEAFDEPADQRVYTGCATLADQANRETVEELESCVVATYSTTGSTTLACVDSRGQVWRCAGELPAPGVQRGADAATTSFSRDCDGRRFAPVDATCTLLPTRATTPDARPLARCSFGAGARPIVATCSLDGDAPVDCQVGATTANGRCLLPLLDPVTGFPLTAAADGAKRGLKGAPTLVASALAATLRRILLGSESIAMALQALRELRACNVALIDANNPVAPNAAGVALGAAFGQFPAVTVAFDSAGHPALITVGGATAPVGAAGLSPVGGGAATLGAQIQPLLVKVAELFGAQGPVTVAVLQSDPLASFNQDPQDPTLWTVGVNVASQLGVLFDAIGEGQTVALLGAAQEANALPGLVTLLTALTPQQLTALGDLLLHAPAGAEALVLTAVANDVPGAVTLGNLLGVDPAILSTLLQRYPELARHPDRLARLIIAIETAQLASATAETGDEDLDVAGEAIGATLQAAQQLGINAADATPMFVVGTLLHVLTDAQQATVTAWLAEHLDDLPAVAAGAADVDETVSVIVEELVGVLWPGAIGEALADWEDDQLGGVEVDPAAGPPPGWVEYVRLHELIPVIAKVIDG